MDLASQFKQTISQGIVSSSLSSCSRWSSHRRVMGHPFPGAYSWKHHPWVREILDSKASFNVTLKAAQMGFTEVGINRALYTVDVCKRDVLYVLPTALNAADFSKARFGGALENSPYLKSIFTATNTVGLKQAGSTNLYIRGSRGDSNLKSVPASVLILDEFDEFNMKSVGLALERLSGQLEKEVWYISTPTIPAYGVSAEYLLTTQEHFTFQCPSCSKHTELTFPDCVEICGDSVNDPRIYDSHLKCKECGARLPHETKPQWLSKGKWTPTYTNGDSNRRGFHINQLYSFTVKPYEIVSAYMKGLGDEVANKEFHNSKLGVGFVGEGAQVNDGHIAAVLGSHSIQDPRPVKPDRIITMGADQGKTGYFVVKEWFVENLRDPNRTAESKVLDFGRIDQNSRGLSQLDELMVEWQVLAAVIDADPEITLARDFCRRFRKYAWTCRYRAGVTGGEMKVTDEEDGAPMATVDRTHWLGVALGRFKTNRIQLPVEVTNEFKAHVKAPVATWERDEFGNPKQIYISTGADHFAHALVYAEIALPLALKSFTAARDI